MEKIYDLIIIGSGPAGLTAAIYAQRAKLETLVIEASYVSGGQVVNTYEVDNYPGMPGIGGIDLGEAMAAHAEKLGAVPVRENVVSIELDGEIKIVRTKKSEYHAKALILALGASHRHLGIPGEEEFAGMGVSYCATCDGAFFKDRTAVVIGGGNTACEDAAFLARLCRKVYVIHRRDTLRADKILQERLFAWENVEMVWDSIPLEICGQDQVTGIRVQNVKTGKETQIDTDGVFVAVGIVPNTKLVEGLAELDEGGYIAAGEDGLTSVPGIFAAGDVRTKGLRQVVTAVSDGANAAVSAQKYLL